MFVQLLLFVIAHCGTPGPLVQVEVRSGSLAKLFLWSALSFRKLAFPLEKPSRDILVVQSSGACEMSARRNHWQERELWKGSSIDRVSGRRELLPSASEQILNPLRFQETRGGSGACHFGFKAGFSVVAALLRDSLLWGFLMDSADRGKPLTCESRRRSRSAGCSSCSTGRATPPAGVAARTPGHRCRWGAQLRPLLSGSKSRIATTSLTKPKPSCCRS